MNHRKRIILYFFFIMAIMSAGLIWGNKSPAKANTTVCTIVYYSNGGTGIASTNHAMNSQVNSLPVPTREDYIFDGWYFDEALTYRVTTPFYVTNQVYVLFAKWNAITPISMTASYAETTAIYNTLLDPKKIIVTATFSNGTKKTVTDFTIGDLKVSALGINYFTVEYGHVTATFTVYGIEQVYYSVAFVSNGGTNVPAIQGIKKGETISLPAEPIRNGYTFGGWYLESTFVTRFTKDTPVNNNITVYAKWILDEVKVDKEVYELNTYSLALKINQQSSLFIETYNPYLEGDISFRSSNKKVATVSNNDESKGIVTGKTKGTATISVTVPDGSVLKCQVKVGSGVMAKSIKTSVTSKKIKVKGTYTIKTTITPSNVTSKKLSYTSSNKKIATVSSSGKVTGKKKGTCYITVKTTDGSGLSKRVKITVK